MRVVFRTDASLRIGSGHVMRCLTLADALKARGAECQFISRAHSGHLLETIEQRGHVVHSLAANANIAGDATRSWASDTSQRLPNTCHADWLGSTWQADAHDTAAILANLQPDWLVVDHYALDKQWEESLIGHYRNLLVIDDLADRPHYCDLLVDQNLGRLPEHYSKLVPSRSKVLTGPLYALLRPEFSALRSYSLQRRESPQLKNLLISMGGVDHANATGKVLDALSRCELQANLSITVVMGPSAPWLAQVKTQAAAMPHSTQVLSGVNNMAQLIADSDLCIGAAGGTAWERCTLGLPSILLLLAENQASGSSALQAAGAAKFALNINELCIWVVHLSSADNIDALETMTLNASQLCDGMGVSRVVEQIVVDYV